MPKRTRDARLLRSATWDEKAWRKFERIVAALHKFRDQGAEVTWNERIAGRQIDVSVRFERGGYKYLLLIECKNYRDLVPVGEVDAFATKSRRLGANKAIIVAASGFQSGAKEEAPIHGIELYILKEIRDQWPEQMITTQEQGVQISGIVLWPSLNLRPYILPNAQLLAQLRFDPPNGLANQTLQQLVQSEAHLDPSTLTETRTFTIQFRGSCRVGATSLVSVMGAIDMNIRGLTFNAKAATLSLRSLVHPPDIPLRKYVYENAVTGEQTIFGMNLPIGLDNQFRAGAFYRNILDIAYKCERVDNDTVQMFVFLNQHGRQVGVRATMDTKYSPLYAEVTNADETAALEVEYQLWMKADRPGAS